MAEPPDPMDRSGSVASALDALVRRAIGDAGGWLPFDRYMETVLYAPGLGYYANSGRKFGRMPESGSDFVTAPELSPLFGRALAVQVAQALSATGTDTVVEFGAGSGALADQLLTALGSAVGHYQIVELSAALRARQAARLARFGSTVEFLDAWPDAIAGVVVGNEVLDAMPVQLLHFDGEDWFERGVVAAPAGLAWADRPTAMRPPVGGPFAPGMVTEIHPQTEAFVRSLADRLRRGLALFIDYGFPESEYYHPQRGAGTLVCHRGHRVEHGEAAPLGDLGAKDITAHVDFTGIALAAQQGGLEVAGYTSQGRFLINCGLAALLEDAGVAERVMAHRLVAEHEMGELFKVIALVRDCSAALVGFAAGDRTHRL